MARETRKIQKVGGSTFSVSLPKDWARARGLDAGSLVTLFAHPDDVLVVQPGDDDRETERTVTVAHESPQRLERLLRSAYAAGVDAIRFEATESLTREQRRAVGRVTDDLPGTTVVQEREDLLAIRVLLDGSEVSIQQSVRQLAFVASSTHRDAVGALVGEADPDAIDRGAEADRLFALVDRHFQRGCSEIGTLDALDSSRPELAVLRATARELQAVAADARRLGNLVETHGQGQDVDDARHQSGTDADHTAPLADDDLAEAFERLGERARTVLERATDALVAEDGTDDARSALARHAALEDALDETERALFAAEPDVWQGRALEHCRRTADHGATVAQLALRGALRRGDLDAAAPPDPADGSVGAAGVPGVIDGESTEDGVSVDGPDVAPDADD
ncbi:transcription regulator [Salinarchaeum sp. Harcht-Bsk1]|uniref:AbrB/MazE/SpoVT family DNA-binding domain-containing protein n=1 Tax=Salinarchaeum sp. Harcht-Bsk1 TaxID=1333523 RepID=UPI00034234E8|nr:AbrB/MazE/SpoVT family DNA-binding domain-containing protein [Salinarchaeum sp. Harcht-Bsk1]AGN01083.1 transcription regulator [Salinarchaeum sp. Harcht-Bsk1]